MKAFAILLAVLVALAAVIIWPAVQAALFVVIFVAMALAGLIYQSGGE